MRSEEKNRWRVRSAPHCFFPLIAALPVDQSIDRLSAAQCAQPGGDLPDGFFRDSVGGDVRREDEARVMPEGVVGSQRFGSENVQHGKTQMPLVQMGEQGGFVDQRAPSGVDERRV